MLLQPVSNCGVCFCSPFQSVGHFAIQLPLLALLPLLPVHCDIRLLDASVAFEASKNVTSIHSFMPNRVMFIPALLVASKSSTASVQGGDLLHSGMHHGLLLLRCLYVLLGSLPCRGRGVLGWRVMYRPATCSLHSCGLLGTQVKGKPQEITHVLGG